MMIKSEQSEIAAFCEAVRQNIPADKPENRGKAFICKCPACDGNISIVRQAHNGRVHAVCGRCKRSIDL